MSLATVEWVEDPESPSPQRCRVIVNGATDRDVRRQSFSLMADVDLFGGWAVFSEPCRQQDGTFAAIGGRAMIRDLIDSLSEWTARALFFATVLAAAAILIYFSVPH